jgi:phage replication O-like protein O
MPQLENGYTRIANELIERLAGIRIPGEAMQALWLILRKTYGFNKKSDTIALLQFCDHTGMNKPAVCRAVKKLEQLGIVSIIKKDNGSAAEYAIIKDSARWQPLSKKITLSKKIINVIEKDNKPLSKKIPSKETTKERKKDNFVFEIPESLSTPEFFTAWQEWQEHRKQIRKKLTPLAVKKQFNELEKIGVARAISAIDNSITNGYTGIYEAKGYGKKPDANTGKTVIEQLEEKYKNGGI